MINNSMTSGLQMLFTHAPGATAGNSRVQTSNATPFAVAHSEKHKMPTTMNPVVAKSSGFPVMSASGSAAESIPSRSSFLGQKSQIEVSSFPGMSKVPVSAALDSQGLNQTLGLFGAQSKVVMSGKGVLNVSGGRFVKPIMAMPQQATWSMSAASAVDTKEPVLGPVKEQQPASVPESDFKIEHSFELLDQDLLQEQTPFLIQSVKLEEFKARLSNLECLLLRGRDDDAKVVARELAQRLYLGEDKQTIILDQNTATQIQMVSILNAAPVEVQDEIQVFKDQLIQK